MEPQVINIVRLALLGALLFQCFIVLGLAGHGLSLFPSGATPPDYLGVDVAVPVLTLITVATCIAIERFRKGVFTSMVAFELGWTGLLMILWLGAAADTASFLTGIDCSFSDGFLVTGVCHEQQALIAFTWLSWLTIVAWFGLLITLSVISHTRGNVGVWKQPVVGTDFYASRINEPVQMEKEGPPPQQFPPTNMNSPYPGQVSPAAHPPNEYNPTSQQQV